MGGAPPRTRSPAARGAPRAGGACAVPAAAAPGHRLRGTGEPWPLRAAVFSGSWASSCCPLPSRLGGRAPSESPARRRRSRGRLHVASAPSPPPPAPRPAPPGSGECLAAGAPRLPPRRAARAVRFGALRGSPSRRRVLPASSASGRRRSLCCPRSPHPSSVPSSVPTRRAARTGSRFPAPSLPRRQPCGPAAPRPVPSGTSVSTALHLGLPAGMPGPEGV